MWRSVLIGLLIITCIFSDNVLFDEGMLTDVEPFTSIGNIGLEILGSNPPDDENWWIYPEIPPGQIYVAPQIDWSKCWPVLLKHISWSLEGSIYGETWHEEIPGSGINLTTDILNLGVVSIGENSSKVTLDFTAIDPPGPETSAYYRFSLAIDYRVKKYVSKTAEHQYNILYEVDNETFNLTLDWSDYIDSSLANHSHIEHVIT